MNHHPDPAYAKALERNARSYTGAVTAPPPEIADDPAAYIQWLREQRPQLPPRPPQRKEFRRLYERDTRAWVPPRIPVQEGQEASPLAWVPTPEETGRLDGHGAARYGSAVAAQNDARNAALAGLAAQIRPPARRPVVPAQRPAPKTDRQLEDERARQLAALQQMIEKEQREGGAS